MLFAVATAGCVPFPVRWQDTPPASGQVVDAVSAKPISGAIVIIHAGGSTRKVNAQTDDSGAFNLAPTSHWRIIPAPMDVFEPPATLSISTPGYRSFQQTMDVFQRLHGTTIKLDPAP